MAAGNGTVPRQRRLAYTVRAGDAVAHAIMRDGTVEVGPGEHPAPDLVIIGGPGFRDLLAGTLELQTAIAERAVELDGDAALLTPFATTFTVAYTAAADA